MKKLFFSIFILTISLISLGQSNPNWMYFSYSGQIQCIEEDSNSIWVGTLTGLVKIDKQTMQKTFFNKVNSDIPFNIIRKIYIDNQDRLWVVGGWSDAQLVMYNGNTWIPFYFDKTNGNYEFQLLDIKQTYSGRIWVAEYEGLYSFDNNFLVNNGSVHIGDSSYLFFGKVFSIATDTCDNVYFGTYLSVKKIDAQGNVSNYGQSGMMDFPAVLEFNPQNVLYVGTQQSDYISYSIGRGEVYYTLGNGHYQYLGNPPPYQFTYVFDMSFAPNGDLYVATNGQGIVKYSNNQISQINISSSFVDTNSTTAVHYDMNGSLWIGTLSGSLYKITGGISQKVNVSNSNLVSNNFAIYQKKNGAYLLQSKEKEIPYSPSKYALHIINNYDTITPLATRNRYLINWSFDDNYGSTWGYSGSFLYKLTDTILQEIFIDTSLVGNNYGIQSIDYDSINNKILLGIGKSIISYQNNNFSFVCNFMSSINNYITSLQLDDNGVLWVGSNGNGVSSYYNGAWTSYNTSWGLFNSYICSITKDNENAIWCSTIDGKLGKIKSGVWTIFDDSNSPIISNYIQKPHFGRNNKLYLLDYYVGLLTLDNNVWNKIPFDSSNFEFSSRELFVDNNDNLWMLGKGITVYNPNGVILGIDHKPNNEDILINTFIYPNPVDQIFYIDDKKFNYPYSLSIITIENRLIRTQIIFDNKGINVEDLSNGVYIIKLQNSFGESFTNKLVIKH